jgi:hypothetical protein
MSNILQTIGTIVGLVTGGPKGAALGSGLGTLLSGGSFKDALTSGVGSLFATNPQMQMATQMFNFGSDSSPSGRGSQIINMANKARQASPVGNFFQQAGMGQPTQAFGIPGIFNALISQETDNPLNALVSAALLNQMTKNKNPFSAMEQRQYETGERVPDYRGTPVPDFRYPSGIVGAAQGGMIRGPGTGKSDSIPAAIYQNGGRVQEARLSDGEFVMTADAVKGAGDGDRAKGAAKMYRMMNQLERRA